MLKPLEVNMHICLFAQFVAHQEILPKLDAIYESSAFDKKWRRWHISTTPRPILREILTLYLDYTRKQTGSRPFLFNYLFIFIRTSSGRSCIFFGYSFWI